MTEKEAMFRRHSVRIYQDKKIEESKIILINEKIAEINREGDLNIHFSEDSGKTFTVEVQPELRMIEYYTGNG